MSWLSAIAGGIGTALVSWLVHKLRTRSLQRKLDAADALALELSITGVKHEETIRRLREAHDNHVQRLTRANAIETHLRAELEDLRQQAVANATPGSAARRAGELRRKADAGGDPPR